MPMKLERTPSISPRRMDNWRAYFGVSRPTPEPELQSSNVSLSSPVVDSGIAGSDTSFRVVPSATTPSTDSSESDRLGR